MSSKVKRNTFESVTSLISDFAQLYKEQTPARLEAKGLRDVFVYLQERGDRGPWIVLESTAPERYTSLSGALALASRQRKSDKTFYFRYEKFSRYELKKEFAPQVLRALKSVLKQRQDMSIHFKDDT